LVKPIQKSAGEIENEIKKRFRSLTANKATDLRMIRREFSTQIASFEGTQVIKLALNILNSQAAPRFVAYELVHYSKAAMACLNSRNIKALGEGINSWDAVDTFACYLSGPAWREGRLSDSLINKWTTSKDRWWRRAAVVSTVPLNNKARGGSGDAQRTLQICRLVVRDRDDMVVKAVSWALRELSKRDRAQVVQFIDEYRDQLAARVLREVNNKLTTGLKVGTTTR
jgi:3-methyladenine DNA glycosylase AlkD